MSVIQKSFAEKRIDKALHEVACSVRMQELFKILEDEGKLSPEASKKEKKAS